jgi:guanylate kinase
LKLYCNKCGHQHNATSLIYGKHFNFLAHEFEKTPMLDNDEIREAIREIVKKYDVVLVSVLRNIQASVDVFLDQNIYYKEQEKMENEIRAIKGVVINDIDYRDIA